MSEFHYIQMPPDGTGKRSGQSGTIEVHYSSGTTLFTLGEVVTTDSGLDGNIILIEGNVSTGEIYLKLNHGSTTSVTVGESLKVGGVGYAVVSQDSADFYNQQVVITGANNPLNGVTVSDEGAMFMQFPSGKMAYDSFGKLMGSKTTTIREYQTVDNELPDEFSLITTGDADLTYDDTRNLVVLRTGTGIGDKVSRRSNLYHKYQTGVGTTVIMSGFIGDIEANCDRRLGLFDDNNGLFFHADNDHMGCVVRSDVSGVVTETDVHQESWNGDRLDGSGDANNISRILLDPLAMQIMWIDIQMGGRVRFGFIIEGEYIVAHEFDFANSLSNPFMRTATLPVSFEQENTGAVGSPSYFYISNAKVACEGDYNPKSSLYGGTLPPTTVTKTTGDVTTVASVTLTSTGTLVDGTYVNFGAGYATTTNGSGTGARVYVVIYGGGFGSALIVIAGGSGYAVGDTLVVAESTDFSDQATGTLDSAVVDINAFNVPVGSFRARHYLHSGAENRGYVEPIDVKVQEVTGIGDAVVFEIVRNDTISGGFWVDASSPAEEIGTEVYIGGTLSEGGIIMYSTVLKGEQYVDLTSVFNFQSQVLNAPSDVTVDSNHYTYRLRPLSSTPMTFTVSSNYKEIK